MFQQQRRLIDNDQMLNDGEKCACAHYVVVGPPLDVFAKHFQKTVILFLVFVK